jgi:hypothetical protein
MLLYLALSSCTGSGDGGNKDKSNDSADSGAESHPHVPEEYQDKWSLDGCSDDDGNKHTVAYILGEGSTDADGNLTLTEHWYWIYPEAGYEDDCVDELNYSGTRVTASVLGQLNASESEEGYWGTLKSGAEGCPAVNYLGTWDHPDADKFDYGDKWETDFIVVFDTLTPSGNLNWENAMLVYMFIMDGNSAVWASTDYARGVFEPDTEALEPPAHYSWETSICFSG